MPEQRLFRLFGVSSSGYYAYLKRSPSTKILFNQNLDMRITTLFEAHRGLYGYQSLYYELLELGYNISRERIRRRMKNLNLKVKQRKRYKQTTYRDHRNPVAENLLNRRFSMNKINQA